MVKKRERKGGLSSDNQSNKRQSSVIGGRDVEPGRSHANASRKTSTIFFLLLFIVSPAISVIIYGRLKAPVAVTDPDLPYVYQRGLVKTDVDYREVLTEHLKVSSNLTERQFENPVLAYVTPWNAKGYDMAKKFHSKLTHISPVWYDLKSQGSMLTLEGRHNADAGWISELRMKSNIKILPRVVLEAIPKEYLLIKKQRDTLIDLIIGECQEMDYDGMVLESWSRWANYGVLHDPEMRKMALNFLKQLGEAMHTAKIERKGLHHLQLVYVISPPFSDEVQPHDFKPEDLRSLSNSVDGFSLMTYDFSLPHNPGPNAPLKWIRSTLKFLLGVKKKDPGLAGKIFVGINFYGNDFALSEGLGGGPILGRDYVSLLEQHKPAFQWEKKSFEHYFTYIDSKDIKHVVFYPTLMSIAMRLKEARSWGAGISIWEIGQGNKTIEMAKTRSNSRTGASASGSKKNDGSITKYSQYRNSISYLLDAYNSIRTNLTSNHRNIMQQTPFKLFFKAIDENKICSNKRRDQVLDNIITAYVPEKKGIKIGRGCCQLRRTDIKLIFGIMDGHLKVDKYHGKKVKSEFADRVFPNAQNITAKMMKEKLVELVDNEDATAVVDTVRVLCLLMFQACFFTNTGQTIAWTYVKYVENMDTLKHYDWSSAIYDTLIQSLEKKSKKPRTVNGCTSSLLYWMCEHDKTVKPRQEEDPMKHENQEDTSSIHYSGIPRCTKWDLSTLNKFVNKATIIGLPNQSVIWTELEPTPAELQLIPDLTKNPVAHDSDFEDDIPMQQLKLRIKLQPVEMHEQDKNAQFMDEPSQEDSLHITQLEEQQQNDTYHSEENADFMDEDPFEQNVQGMLEFRNEERDSIEKTLKERDDKAERLKAKVKRMKKKLRKLERKEHEISKQKEEIRITEELNSELLVKLKKFEERENEIKSNNFNELEEVYKGVVDGLKKENAGLLASLTDALIKDHSLQKHVNEMRSRLEEFEHHMTKSSDQATEEIMQLNTSLTEKVKHLENENCTKEATISELNSTVSDLQNRLHVFEEIRQLNTSLTEKVKHLEDENCTKEATISELNSTVSDLQNRLDAFEEIKKSYESKIKEQKTKIDALNAEIENAAVHAVTQQYGNTDAKQVQKSVKQSSRVKALKERKRTARKDDDFVYPEDKKRKTETLDLTNEAAIEDVQRMEKFVKVSLKKKKAGYTCGAKITEEAFQLLHTTMKKHGRLGEVWTDIESGTRITVHDMVNLLEGSFIADKVIDAFATMLSRNEEVRKEFHILPASTWAYCKKYEATGNYSNHFVDNMKPHLEEGKNILIPLCCPGAKDESYHWILLTFASGEQGEWHMYNSLASRKGAVDHFEKNALDIQKYLWKCFCPSDKLKAKKIKKVAKLPQQGSDMNDCAIYVMYYIFQIALNQPIDKKWNTDAVQDFKAFLVNSITSNKMNIAMLANITVNV